MKITIDRDDPTPIYLQIAQQIQELISSGSLGRGDKLLPERRLARELGINRSTVLQAYRHLRSEGLVDSHVGRGTTVVGGGGSPTRRVGAPSIPWHQLMREGAGHAADPLLQDLLRLSERRDVISLALGLPAPELIPIDRFRQIEDRLIGEVGPSLFLHSPAEGHTPLRETLGLWERRHGIECDPSEVLVISGSQQGLDLVARTLLGVGDTVVVEEPTYFGALGAFRAAGVRLVGVPIDEEGMRTDVLASMLERRRPKLIYTLPTFQNPSGTVMSLERRHQLLDLAYRYQVPIVEDDPYGELRYDGDDVPSLRSLDRHGFVLYLSTLSKTLFPGLRVGWLVAPRPVIRQLVLAKQSIDLHTNTLAQYVFERFVRDDHFDRHLDVVREAYATRRDLMARALTRRRVPGLTWRRPDGGFYFWCRLPEGVERSQLLTLSARAGIVFLPGWACFAHEPDESYIRLNFSHPGIDEIGAGVARLLDAISEASSQPRSPHLEQSGTPPIV